MKLIGKFIRYANYVFFIVAFLVIIAMWLGFFSSLQPEERDAVHVIDRQLFYIYDLSNDDIDVLPKVFNHHRLSFQKQFLENGGVGPLINNDVGMYHTHQYSLFPLFYQRLLESKYRTLDPTKASQFFIPYDLGMDSSTRQVDGALAQTNCPRVQSVMNRVRASPYFQRNLGADHFMLHSINQMMVYYANDVCAELYQLCFNCTKLSIDAYPPGVFAHLDAHPHMSHKWISIPFPSNYHYSDAVTIPPWVRGSQFSTYYMSHKYQQERPYALTFMGSAQVTAKQQRRLRMELIKACRAFPAQCLLVELGGHESHENTFKAAAETGPSENNNPYSRARFCLTPGGDFPTRKGFFDALLSGCVPVIFEQTAALTQWPLHWTVPRSDRLFSRLGGLGFAGSQGPVVGLRGAEPVGAAAEGDDATLGVEHLASSCVVYIPRDVAVRNMSKTFEYLVGLSQETDYMAERLRCIAKVGYQMQYSMPEKFNVRKNVVRPRDAVDVILDHLLATV